MVTKPGLSIPVGEPAINPVPRRMIVRAIREITDLGVSVAVSIPGGLDIAKKTFNPRLGIQGGLSILGTSGRVVPFSCPAIRESLRYVVRVASASTVRYPVIVPGKIGARAAERHFCFVQNSLISVGNEWGVVLDEAADHDFIGLLVVGHPGKLAKLIDGYFQTHSKNSKSALPIVHREAAALTISTPRETPTVEGCLSGLSPQSRSLLSTRLAAGIQKAIEDRVQHRIDTSVVLINMNGDLLGTAGNLMPWSMS
jgi:cobalt-precorrin-5B (C1)-methyltransferase